jgi:hypothetical protein
MVAPEPPAKARPGSQIDDDRFGAGERLGTGEPEAMAAPPRPGPLDRFETYPMKVTIATDVCLRLDARSHAAL